MSKWDLNPRPRFRGPKLESNALGLRPLGHPDFWRNGRGLKVLYLLLSFERTVPNPEFCNERSKPLQSAYTSSRRERRGNHSIKVGGVEEERRRWHTLSRSTTNHRRWKKSEPFGLATFKFGSTRLISMAALLTPARFPTISLSLCLFIQCHLMQEEW